MPTPVKVDLPSNRSGNEDLASNRLQHATQVLQAALANWEACMQGNVEVHGVAQAGGTGGRATGWVSW
eukprot:symbB.v1.2.016620.t1/scaffold1200.1/size132039/10